MPTGSYARVTIAVVDTLGNNLGMVQSRDAALFGSDVSLQKARVAALLSSASAASYVSALPPTVYLRTDSGALTHRFVTLSSYVTTAQAFVGDSSAYANGVIAYSDRALGNLARPFYPDGIDGTVFGPFSLAPGPVEPVLDRVSARSVAQCRAGSCAVRGWRSTRAMSAGLHGRAR